MRRLAAMGKMFDLELAEGVGQSPQAAALKRKKLGIVAFGKRGA